jgi:hypothetical protein
VGPETEKRDHIDWTGIEPLVTDGHLTGSRKGAIPTQLSEADGGSTSGEGSLVHGRSPLQVEGRGAIIVT